VLCALCLQKELHSYIALQHQVVIKIADFGLSKDFTGESDLVTSCGTPDYAAPFEISFV